MNVWEFSDGAEFVMDSVKKKLVKKCQSIKTNDINLDKVTLGSHVVVKIEK